MNPEFASRMKKTLPRIILVGLLLVLAFLGWKIVHGGIHIPPLADAIDDIMAKPPQPMVELPSNEKPFVSNIVEIPDEWLVVIGNNVLFWPVVGGKCQKTKALMQVHVGTKALVIMHHDDYVEVELNNQSLPHTHGCIHNSLLGTVQ